MYFLNNRIYLCVYAIVLKFQVTLNSMHIADD
jgi:hypothetical protein